MFTIGNLYFGKEISSSNNLTLKAFDYKHIKSIFAQFSSCRFFYEITDVMNFMSSCGFLDITSSSAQHLDIVIVCCLRFVSEARKNYF